MKSEIQDIGDEHCWACGAERISLNPVAWLCGRFPSHPRTDTLACALRRLAQRDAEIARRGRQLAAAKAIIDKLPKTADGVPVVPGMELYYLHTVLHGDGPDTGKTWKVHQPLVLASDHLDVEVAFATSDDRYEVTAWLSDCYSTKEAAEAAQAQT